MAHSDRGTFGFRVILTLLIVSICSLLSLVSSQSPGSSSLLSSNDFDSDLDLDLNETTSYVSNLTQARSDEGQSQSADVNSGIDTSSSTAFTTSTGGDYGKEHPTLVMTQILFRHGSRAPTHFYPTDPHKDDWPMGEGELTTQGMLEGYHLGQNLRHHYHSFLGDAFDLKQIYIRSADVQRAIMAAECVSVGLFPADFPQTSTSTGDWPFGEWQPVPIHTMPLDIDKALSPSTVCQYVHDLRKGLFALHDSKQKLLRNKTLMFQLSLHTDMEMNVDTLHQLADNIFHLKSHNKSLPSWLSKDMENELIAHYFNRPPFLVEQARYLAGNLLQEMLSNVHKTMKNIHSNRKHTKMFLYSGHDINIHALMSLLQVYEAVHVNHTLVQAFVVELHHLHSRHYLKFLYKIDDDSPPREIILPGCVEEMCLISRFEKLYGESMEEDWDQVCSGEKRQERLIDFGDQTVPILISAVVFLLLLNIMLVFKVCQYHQRLHKLPFKEEYSLVHTHSDSNDEDDETELASTNSSKHHSRHLSNGGGLVNHLQNGKVAANNNHHIHNHLNGGFSDSDSDDDDDDDYEETTLFIHPLQDKDRRKEGIVK